MLTFTTTTNGLKNTVLSLERQQTGLEYIDKPQEDVIKERNWLTCYSKISRIDPS